jgi:hypothetical protein
VLDSNKIGYTEDKPAEALEMSDGAAEAEAAALTALFQQ